MKITVLRYGHREVRDYRVTSHCALVARAFGAEGIVICGDTDPALEKTILGVNERFGSTFAVTYTPSWKQTVANYKKKGYISVHLTMYGLPVQKVDTKLGKQKKLLVIIGSQKVEREVYETVDYNVSVTLQPHSEIAALSVFLDRVQKGKELDKKFKHGDRKIIPQAQGKMVVRTAPKIKK